MKYVWNKKTGIVFPYSEALLKKKNVEEIDEEKALPILEKQQKGDSGFRTGGDAAAAVEADKTQEQMQISQMAQEIANLKAQLEAKAEDKAPSPEPGPKPDSTETSSPGPAKEAKPARGRRKKE